MGLFLHVEEVETTDVGVAWNGAMPPHTPILNCVRSKVILGL